jgi:hypothetical protein
METSRFFGVFITLATVDRQSFGFLICGRTDLTITIVFKKRCYASAEKAQVRMFSERTVLQIIFLVLPTQRSVGCLPVSWLPILNYEYPNVCDAIIRNVKRV